MANIMISYNRQNKAIARTLANDIEKLGHTVWFDQELSGGQAWWDRILETVRNSDVFVFILDQESLNSTACNREYGYAANLGKPILPVLVAEDVSINLLPPALSQIQFVDYRKQDRDTAFRLARALTTVPPPKPLPNPLPPPPEVPISYLGNLTEQVETTSTLSYEEQSALIVDLKRSLRDPETADDARTLLERLRKRRDLLAAIAEEIDELLDSKRKASSDEPKSQVTQNVKEASARIPMEAGRKPLSTRITQPQRTQPTLIATSSKMILRKRLKCSLCGAILGTAVGLMAMATFPRESLIYGLLTGAGGAIAGAITGPNRRLIISALVGAVLVWFVVALFAIEEGPIAAGGVFGAPPGAILGAIFGVILRKLKIWP